MARRNEMVRKAAKDSGVPFWLIAEHLGISEATMTRMLRRELPEEEQAKMLELIAAIAATKENGGN